MSVPFITHKYENGNTSLHDVGGIVFILDKVVNKDGTTTVHYHNLLEHYPTPEDHAAITAELVTGIETGVWSRRTLHALVRSGNPTHWRYFPIPLLFEEDDKIRQQSEDRGLPANSTGWYRRKRNLILRIVNFPAIP